MLSPVGSIWPPRLEGSQVQTHSGSRPHYSILRLLCGDIGVDIL